MYGIPGMSNVFHYQQSQTESPRSQDRRLGLFLFLDEKYFTENFWALTKTHFQRLIWEWIPSDPGIQILESFHSRKWRFENWCLQCYSQSLYLDRHWGQLQHRTGRKMGWILVSFFSVLSISASLAFQVIKERKDGTGKISSQELLSAIFSISATEWHH